MQMHADDTALYEHAENKQQAANKLTKLKDQYAAIAVTVCQNKTRWWTQSLVKQI